MSPPKCTKISAWSGKQQVNLLSSSDHSFCTWGTFDVYHQFFTHLSLKLSSLGAGIVFGTDAEASLVRAIVKWFEKPVMLRCSNHLKDNVQDYLKDRIGMTIQDRSLISGELFGLGGMAQSNSEAVLEVLSTSFKTKWAHVKGLNDYIEKKICPVALENILKPLWYEAHHQCGC